MYLKALSQSAIISAIFFFLHIGLSTLIGSPTTADLVLIHAVLFSLTFGGYCALLAIDKFDHNKVGFTFLAISTLKLLVSASLILIMVRVFEKPNAIAIHYAGIYFFYVLFLAFQTFRLVNLK